MIISEMMGLGGLLWVLASISAPLKWAAIDAIGARVYYSRAVNRLMEVCREKAFGRSRHRYGFLRHAILSRGCARAHGLSSLRRL
jgi:hypothetical protein